MRLRFFREKRKHPRSFLDLPVEYRVEEFKNSHGGIAVDGGEGGFLIHCPYNMPVGTKLQITVMFPDGFELTHFEAHAEVVRKDDPRQGRSGFKYGLKLIQCRKEERPKLRHLLTGLHQLLNTERS